MKLTGAYGGANLNIKREESLKKLSKLDSNVKKLSNEKAEFTGVNKFEALSAQALEQTKYYQTKISQLQHSNESLDLLEKFLKDSDSLGNRQDIEEFKAELERIINNPSFRENEVLSDLSLSSLGYNKDIDEAKKIELIKEALLKIKVKRNSFEKEIESYKEEIMKIKLAYENIRAAKSHFDDIEVLRETLGLVKDGIEANGLDLQNKTSQARVMNILKN